MALKHKQQASSSHKTSSGSNSHPSTLESKQMETSRKSSLTLAVNSILQELLRGSAGSSTAYRKANSKANQGLKSASQSHSRSKAQMVPKFIAGEIIFIPCGTKQPKKTLHSYIPLLTPVLHNPQMPTLVEVQTLEVMRLAITDHDDDYKEHQDEIFQYLPQYYLSTSHDLTKSESISDDSDDDSSSKSSLSKPPQKSKYCQVLPGTDDEILPASDSKNLSESATIVDLTASDNEYPDNFFSSFKLDNHEVVAEPEVAVEADLAPFEPFESPGPVSTLPSQTGEIFATPTLQASGSFVIDPSLDNPWEGNHLFDF
ncbi:uncharacterized protein BJ212DRAFT_1294711 [Suillus subaureus]|uniref:Uncharacterized protein n=1 Tax=Suillus subaureus TaxID=48587 RepID=A0A9P7EQM8_9AGAM|nr:uncharacterized protein BJ212DRAFT_1294711 [Suillus subaureus]KAG1827435.1 hypothetical protein BJ212DRAFT_1294711 [Suillus subaureus]